jgi:LacI family transcriptional regulator
VAAGPSSPTLAVVARRAGVSTATVSKVLNGRPGVSERTRERVEEVIRSLGYVPSTGRRARQERPEVTVVFHGFVDLYSAQVLSGVVAAAAEQGVDVVVADVADTTDDVPLGRFWLEERAAQGHVGVVAVTTVLTPRQIADCADVGLGLVVIDPVLPAVETELVSVSATNRAGGVQATQHLVALGHRRIGFAGGPPDSQPARERLQGHLAALRDHGIEPDPALVLQDGFEHADGAAMGERLLSVPDPPTAVVAGCDASALGVMQAARGRGLRLPEDLAVVGFDDTYAAGWTTPSLTTVRQPMREMGRVALRTVVALGRGGRPGTRRIELATRLVVRSSTGPGPYAGGTRPL